MHMALPHACFAERTLASATTQIDTADVLPTMQASSADAQARLPRKT